MVFVRSQSVPNAYGSGGLPRVTVSDFSSIDLSEMYDVLPPGAASTAADAAAEPTEIDYVTLEDVAPFKPHNREANRDSVAQLVTKYIRNYAKKGLLSPCRFCRGYLFH